MRRYPEPTGEVRMTLSLRFAAGSHVGMIREGNEDSGYAGPRLLAVADGMGGQAAGEVASAGGGSSSTPAALRSSERSRVASAGGFTGRPLSASNQWTRPRWFTTTNRPPVPVPGTSGARPCSGGWSWTRSWSSSSRRNCSRSRTMPRQCRRP